MKKYLFLLTIYFISQINAQSITAKREFRGAWIATVINLDWPPSPTSSVKEQQESLIDLLNELEKTNINAVFFQIRSESDAFYQSDIEPWSYWLTGEQGKAPNPYYDPLEFAIEEAHKRGMELHAWFNPYRVERNVDNYSHPNNHVSVTHPDWIIQIGKIKVLDPGIPEARTYVSNIIMDVVNRYNVDGIHFDDYFYPYPPNNIATQDNQTFSTYPRGFSNIHDWRRDNVNELVRNIYDSIQVVKPHVKFGISPFGIWKNGVPSGISGLDAYGTIYCDAIAWLNEHKVDYIVPQLYWAFGGGQDYGKLLPWWADKMNGRHLMPGQAMYRASGWSSDEIPRQIRLNRQTTNVYGNVFFRAQNIPDNPKGVTDKLKDNYFKSKALIPSMSWKDQLEPNQPMNLRYDALVNERGDGLIWDVPSSATDGDSASMYAIYKFDNSTILLSDLEEPSNISKITGNSYVTLTSSEVTQNNMYFVATSLDDNHNESGMSNVVEVQLVEADIPELFLPENAEINQRDTVILSWSNSLHSSLNHLVIATDQNFTEKVIEKNSIVDTSKSITNLDGQQTYYWKVSALNLAGESDFSEVFTFKTGFPIVSYLSSPEDKTTDVDLLPKFTWNVTPKTSIYQFQLAEGLSVEPSITIVDTLVADTTLTLLVEINPDKIFSWRVRANNEYGNSKWSDVSKFKTKQITSVENHFGTPNKFALSQNYPNPFNPETTINFSIPTLWNTTGIDGTSTTLKVYDVLGREVSVLINENLRSGNYSIVFDGSNLSSGIYFYVLNFNGKMLSNKMILTK